MGLDDPYNQTINYNWLHPKQMDSVTEEKVPEG